MNLVEGLGIKSRGWATAFSHPIIFNYLRDPMDWQTSSPVHGGSCPPNNHMAPGGYTLGFDCRSGFRKDGREGWGGKEGCCWLLSGGLKLWLQLLILI
ncbi:hypothetical protein DID88_000469 [Monilinia fructigena]|uniref:Uncharacterized protein n=1 Tax=Monilinia fructigena TaxID=38457 RepID=A0A395IHY9_9HELO|nr:hypothetical protein DID88_000469 [Monilinia fructigena]